MKTDFRCSSCGAPIPAGTGLYSTPDGTFCLSCGLPIPLGPGKVKITIIDGEGKLDQYRYTNKNRR